MNQQQYNQLLHKFARFLGTSKLNDPLKNYQDITGRYEFAVILATFFKEYESAIRIMHSIIQDTDDEYVANSPRDIRVSILALVHLGVWSWQHHSDYGAAQNHFEGALDKIDEYPEHQDLVGKVFYHRSLLMYDCEQGDVALNIAFEIVDSYTEFVKKRSSKSIKMFYTHLAISTIAYREGIYDIAVEQLWSAIHHLQKLTKVQKTYLRERYRRREGDPQAIYDFMYEHIESWI